MMLTTDARIFGSCSCSILGQHSFEETSSALGDCEIILLLLQSCQGLVELMDLKEQGHVHLNIRKKLLAVRTIIRWYCLPRDVVESPLLQVFKMRLDRVVDNLIYAPFRTKGWTRWSFKLPSIPGCYMIPY